MRTVGGEAVVAETALAQKKVSKVVNNRAFL